MTCMYDVVLLELVSELKRKTRLICNELFFNNCSVLNLTIYNDKNKRCSPSGSVKR